MLSGFYTLASGMLTQQRSLNTTSNNIANVKTPGFKEDRVVTSTFQQLMLTRQEGGVNTTIGKGDPVRTTQDVTVNFDPGAIEETQRDFDLAISGEGFFNILGTDGETYLTRNGQLDLDEEGYLVLPGKGRVQGMRGDIKLDGAYFTVTQQGVVFDEQHRLVDTLKITAPQQGTYLNRAINGMYRTDPGPALTPEQIRAQMEGTEPAAAGDTLTPVANPLIVQGALERSNIDYNREMALMIETQRNFQSCSKALQMVDTVNQKTVSIASL